MTGNTLFLLLRRWKLEARIGVDAVDAESEEGKGERRRGVERPSTKAPNGDYSRREGGSKIGTKKGE